MPLRDASGRFVSSGQSGLGMRVHVQDNTRRVRRAAQKGAIRSIRYAAGYVRKVIANLIRSSKRASTPGSPPHTQTRQLPRSIKYAVFSAYHAIVGASYSDVGPTGKKHEFGGPFKGANYPPRPFARPGLEKARPRVLLFYRGSIRPF